jgi:hypothetical protein
MQLVYDLGVSQAIERQCQRENDWQVSDKVERTGGDGQWHNRARTPEGTEKIKDHSQETRWFGRDSNWAPLVYTPRVLFYERHPVVLKAGRSKSSISINTATLSDKIV